MTTAERAAGAQARRWVRDLVGAALFAVGGAAALGFMDVFEHLHAISRVYEPWNLDELVLSVWLFALSIVWFAWRRQREAQRHLRARTDLERDLRKSHDELSFLISAAPGALYACEAGGDFAATFVSPSVKAQHGYDPSDFTGDPQFWADHIHPEDKEHVFAGLASLFEHGRHDHQYRFRNSDGSYAWMHDQLTLFRDSDGKPDRIVGFWHDITDHKEFEQRIRHLVESFSSGIYIHAKFKPIYANQTLLDMFGFDGQEDFLSIDSTETLLASEERERIWQYHQARLRGDPAPADYDFWALKKNGEKLYVNNRSFVVDWDGQQAVCTTLFDLTERLATEKSLVEQQHLMNSLLETTQEGFWFIDLDACTTDVNPAMCRILNRPREEIIGKSIFEFVDDENRKIFHEQIARRRKAATGAYEIALRRPDGTNVSCLNNATPLFTSEGERSGSVGIWADITEIKTTQRKLEREKERAQAASIAKSEFLAIASHELRTPMNGVLGAAGLLLATDLSDEQQHRVEIIKQSGESLLELLNDILDIAKIESGRIEIERSHFDLRGLMTGVAALMQLRARQKGLGYECCFAADVPAVLVGDLARLRQILINLVGNAIKFTAVGEIRISVSQTTIDQTSSLLRFEITDTGLGIDERAQPRVFEKFTQADASTTRKFGGTGLGLAICRNLVELQGGEIGVDSVLGEGSTFWFTVICGIGDRSEIVDRQAADASTDARALADCPPLRILLAEDNQINQEIAKDTLAKRGHRVDVVWNGIQALEAVQKVAYDVVLMDIRMPEMDGPTATRKIRELTGDMSKVPIIALTANAMVGDSEKFLAAGMNGYVSKPFDPNRLFATIADCVQMAPVSAARRHFIEYPTAAGAPADPVLDAAVVEPLRLGTPDLWQRLIAVYRETTLSGHESLERALNSDDRAAVRMTAHTLKSSSANMGAQRLSGLYRQLETAAGEASLDKARALSAEIRREFESVRTALARDDDGDTMTERSTA